MLEHVPVVMHRIAPFGIVVYSVGLVHPSPSAIAHDKLLYAISILAGCGQELPTFHQRIDLVLVVHLVIGSKARQRQIHIGGVIVNDINNCTCNYK